MRNIRPVHIIREENVHQAFMAAVWSGIVDLLSLAGVAEFIQVVDYGLWREQPWHDGTHLVPFRSVDWYVEEARRASRRRNQLAAGRILDLCQDEPWQKEPHYDVVVLGSDIYDGEDTNFVLGLTRPTLATAISINRLARVSDGLEQIKTLVMHEVGHVFGLVSPARRTSVQSLGTHCGNRCVMRQGMVVPTDWIVMTGDRLLHGALCTECLAELRGFFN
jgi:predicted Zn-dependent protease